MKFKKITIVILLFLIVNGIFSIDMPLLNKWISNWDKSMFDQSGYKILTVAEYAENSFGLELIKNQFQIKITINNLIEFNNFNQTLNAVDKALNSGRIIIDDRGYGKVKFKSSEIIFGSTDLILVLPKLESLLLSWDIDKNISLDLTEKIMDEIIFRYNITSRNFIYNINYINKIKMETGIDDLFQGWSFYLENLFFTLQKGIKNGDTESKDLVNTALNNIDNLKFRTKRQKSNFFYLSIENYEACILLNKNINNVNYFESRIDSKILTAFSIKNLGASDWVYKPFGIELINGIFADVNISNAIRGSQNGVFGILKTGLSIGFGCSAGIPLFDKNPETRALTLVNVISAFSFETIFNINLIDLNNSPFDVDIIFGLDLFPGYLAYIRLFIGINTDGKETGLTVGGKLVFDFNLPQPKLMRNRNTVY